MPGTAIVPTPEPRKEPIEAELEGLRELRKFSIVQETFRLLRLISWLAGAVAFGWVIAGTETTVRLITELGLYLAIPAGTLPVVGAAVVEEGA